MVKLAFWGVFGFLGLVIFGASWVDCATEDAAILTWVTQIKRPKNMNKTKGLTGRVNYGSGSRKKIPTDWTSSRYKTSQYLATCNKAYDLSERRFMRFSINSKSSPCNYGFLGSRISNCNVGVLCDGTMNFDCNREYFKIIDGTIGLMNRCGSFTFDKLPRKARNTGRDVYIDYMGATNSPCAAFCIEDLTPGHTDISAPVRIRKFQEFPAFPTAGNCKCGKRKDIGRIVGGVDALKFEFPWLGGLVPKPARFLVRVPMCGVSLVSDYYAITAAHCFGAPWATANNLQIIFHAHVMDKSPSDGTWSDRDMAWTPGWNLPQETDKSEETIRVDIEEITIHPLYDAETFDYDVAILKFATKVDLASGKVAPICLPFVNEDFTFKEGDTYVVAGWGKASEEAPAVNRLLQKLDVRNINYQTCERHTYPSKRHICAGYLEGGKDSCQGDSGGPLIYKLPNAANQYFLAGVVSTGAGCALRNSPGLYTNVQEVIQWIYLEIANEPTKFCSRQ